MDFGALLVDVSQGPEAANVFRQAGHTESYNYKSQVILVADDIRSQR